MPSSWGPASSGAPPRIPSRAGAGAAPSPPPAGRGGRAAVVERGPVPGEQSRKNWGFVRQQGRDPDEMPLVMEANRLWRSLPRELGADIEWVQGGNLALADDAQGLARFEEGLAGGRGGRRATRAP